jgi:hypothetical protein
MKHGSTVGLPAPLVGVQVQTRTSMGMPGSETASEELNKSLKFRRLFFSSESGFVFILYSSDGFGKFEL